MSNYYECETILDRKEINGVDKYLVKWVGFPSSSNSWEPINNFKQSMHLVNEFEKSLNENLNQISNKDKVSKDSKGIKSSINKDNSNNKIISVNSVNQTPSNNVINNNFSYLNVTSTLETRAKKSLPIELCC